MPCIPNQLNKTQIANASLIYLAVMVVINIKYAVDASSLSSFLINPTRTHAASVRIYVWGDSGFHVIVLPMSWHFEPLFLTFCANVARVTDLNANIESVNYSLTLLSETCPSVFFTALQDIFIWCRCIFVLNFSDFFAPLGLLQFL